VSWSLSVEEWFYLLFSALLLGGVSLTKRRRLCTWVVIALFVIIPTTLRWMIPDSAEWDSHLRKVALLRLDAIAYGVAVAALLRSESPIVRRPMPLFVFGTAAVAYQWVFGLVPGSVLPEHLARTLSLSIAPLGFALCLPAAIRIQRMPALLTWAARRLSAQSYALYLVHLPLVDATFVASVKLGWSPATCILASAISIFGLSYILHRWFEAPIMALRPKQYARRDLVPEPAPVSTI
jgi:peptidoglycan/LPS O-acetylase OafA/YrhL